MRALLDKEMAALRREVIALGQLTVAQLDGALKALEQRDAELARSVALADSALDKAEVAIDGHVLRVMALQQPEAIDLRGLLADLRIASALERIGDHAKTVARRLPAVCDRLSDPLDPDLIAIGRMALDEVADAMRSYELEDADLALAICARDEALDRHFTSYANAALDAMEAGQIAIRPGAFLVYAARNFERIGDQATNIAERVHFAVRGRLPLEDRPRGTEGQP